MSEVVINSQQSLGAYITHLRAQFEKHKYLRMTVKTGKQRTLTQNAALHKYCQMLADKLNDSGMDMKSVLKPDIDIPWTMESAKENLWKPIQKVVTGHDSSTKPQTDQYGEIYEVLNRHLSEKLGVFIPWPSKDAA
ncbi:MAG: hypothetical protein PF440_02520 [Thiomicrorhabdus sp.]|nr:hypothetical protein [Thiomicrorhabdus sp.]